MPRIERQAEAILDAQLYRIAQLEIKKILEELKEKTAEANRLEVILRSEKKLWAMYDCDKWALNLSQCPTIAYSGEIDKQKQAADVMAEALAAHNIDLVHIIAPPLEVRDGCIDLPAGAGLGYSVDDARLRKYTVASRRFPD